MSTAPGRAKQLAHSARSDEQLVRDCLKGKDSAWSALIFRYKNLIFSIPIRYGFSEEDAADIFQAVCMDLLAELPVFANRKHWPAGSFRSHETNAFTGSVKRNAIPCKKSGRRIPWIRRISGQSGFRVSAGLTFARSAVAASPRCRRMVQLLFFETPARPYLKGRQFQLSQAIESRLALRQRQP